MVPEGDVASVESLRAAGERLLAVALAAGEAGDAPALLTADALITYACERVAVTDPERLAVLR